MLIPILVLIESVLHCKSFLFKYKTWSYIIVGYSLLVIIFSFVSIMFSSFSGLILSCHIGLLKDFALFLMELGVAILQAYVLCFLPLLSS
jgi:hypothetical protein